MGPAENERKIKIIVPIPFKPDPKQGIPKKFKKLKNIIKDKLRMREKKYSHSDPFQPDLEQGIQKNRKKNEKN